ncbi:MAG: Fic family protein [Dysgonamonadaceae bacterium]|jgi:Fic family protein|nr:Fic family protein [Dysgonamonadaceae bacterium]
MYWDDIQQAIRIYRRLNIGEAIDYSKFYIYSLIAHSTAIEGSTLTELETKLLLEEGITSNGKPLIHHLMNTDLNNAYQFAVEQAKLKTPVTPELLIAFNTLVMKSTGSEHHAMGGSFDSSKGEYRKCTVTAGYGGKSYMSYQKIPAEIELLCNELKKRMFTLKKAEDIYNLSFDAHLSLVTIHPWVDGNGRTARLLMNYIQFTHNLIPAKIYAEDKKQYIASLIESGETKNNVPFRMFMASQLLKTLNAEIQQYRKEEKDRKEQHRGSSLLF